AVAVDEDAVGVARVVAVARDVIPRLDDEDRPAEHRGGALRDHAADGPGTGDDEVVLGSGVIDVARHQRRLAMKRASPSRMAISARQPSSAFARAGSPWNRHTS